MNVFIFCFIFSSKNQNVEFGSADCSCFDKVSVFLCGHVQRNLNVVVWCLISGFNDGKRVEQSEPRGVEHMRNMYMQESLITLDQGPTTGGTNKNNHLQSTHSYVVWSNNHFMIKLRFDGSNWDPNIRTRQRSCNIATMRQHWHACKQKIGTVHCVVVQDHGKMNCSLTGGFPQIVQVCSSEVMLEPYFAHCEC